MNFWQKISQGLAIMGAVLAAAASLDQVGGSIDLPSVSLKYAGREFSVQIKVRRQA